MSQPRQLREEFIQFKHSRGLESIMARSHGPKCRHGSRSSKLSAKNLNGNHEADRSSWKWCRVLDIRACPSGIPHPARPQHLHLLKLGTKHSNFQRLWETFLIEATTVVQVLMSCSKLDELCHRMQTQSHLKISSWWKLDAGDDVDISNRLLLSVVVVWKQMPPHRLKRSATVL